VLAKRRMTMQLHVQAANNDNIVTNIWVTGVPESWTDAQVVDVVQVAAACGDVIAQRAIETLLCWIDQCDYSTNGTRVYLDAA
jgi:hypothetical protein